MPFNSKTARKAGKKSGASRKAQKPALTEGMAAAAGIIGVPVETLQKAKRAGCRGFMPGNRIDTATVEEWLLLNGDAIGEGQSLNALRRRNIMAKIGAERIEHDALAKDHIGTAQVAEATRRVSRANESVATRLLPADLQRPYIDGVKRSLGKVERWMARKTKHEAKPPLTPPEPQEGSTLDDLRAVLLSWKTKNLELKNALENGELVELAKVHTMIETSLTQPISMARKHTPPEPWNRFCKALKEEFAVVLAAPFIPTPKESTA